ncbi:MAG TPA: metal ABC transporter permease [Gammaproteobacteria bacterium]
MFETLGLFAGSVGGSLIVAIGCAVVGVFLVLRRIVFVGAALAQLSSAGMALAILLESLGLSVIFISDPLVLSFLITLAGTSFFGLRAASDELPPDAGLGVVFVVAGALAVLFLARSAQADIYDLFFGGDVLLIPDEQLLILAAVILPVVLVYYLFSKEFLFVSFDDQMAATLGYDIRRWNVALFATFAIVITFSIRTVGVLLAFAYLVLPALIGITVGDRLSRVFMGAVVSAIFGTLAGFVLSVYWDLPTGPVIIATLGALLIVVWVGGRRARLS